MWTEKKIAFAVEHLAKEYDINPDKVRSIRKEGLASMHDSLCHQVINAVFRYAQIKGVVFADGWQRQVKTLSFMPSFLVTIPANKANEVELQITLTRFLSYYTGRTDSGHQPSRT